MPAQPMFIAFYDKHRLCHCFSFRNVMLLTLATVYTGAAAGHSPPMLQFSAFFLCTVLCATVV